jgi:glutamine synthetase
MDNKSLRSFLEIPYDELEEMNLQAKKKRRENNNEKELKEFYINYLKKKKVKSGYDRFF